MDEQAVREGAKAFGDALVAGDVDRAINSLSNELRRNLGEVLILFPLPANEVTIDSVDHSGGGGAAFVVVLRIAGQTEEAVVQTRWKERDGTPTIIEASHLSRSAIAAESQAQAQAETGAEGASDEVG